MKEVNILFGYRTDKENHNDFFSDAELTEGLCAQKNENRTFSPKVGSMLFYVGYFWPRSHSHSTAQAKFLLNFVKFNSVELKLLRLKFFTNEKFRGNIKF